MKKIVIANRGEIARRILRAAKKRGYEVAVISTAEDRDSLVCREADCVLEVEGFLQGAQIVEKSKQWGANYLHPGYGFLSENATFAALVEESGIIFVGPTSTSMRLMGNKESVKGVAQKCHVPILTAFLSHELLSTPQEHWGEELQKRHISSPYLVKASGGGGGRGMRIVHDIQELPHAIARASEEARAAFNDGTVFIESYLQEPRHIEIQVFGDGKGNGVFFGERECSLQRRHQKVLEESPSSVVTRELRQKMGEASLRLVRETSYRGAGTLEYLLDAAGGFYFLEMNTRLQVEHPVTEFVYNIDLVDAQLELAAGKWPQQFPDPTALHLLEPQGVALEARILAEDPARQFLPTPGKIALYREPTHLARVDSGVEEGGRVNSQFDSMIAKLIVHGKDRKEATEKLLLALQNYKILGFTTNIPFLINLINHPDFLQGRYFTSWIEKNIQDLTRSLLPESIVNIIKSEKFYRKLTALSNREEMPEHIAIFLRQKEKLSSYSSSQAEDFALKASLEEKNAFFFISPKMHFSFLAIKGREEWEIGLSGERFVLAADSFLACSVGDEESDIAEIKAPMAGKVLEILVQTGENIFESQVLFIVESMKMQLEIKSPKKGVVKEIFVTKGQGLQGATVLALVEKG